MQNVSKLEQGLNNIFENVLMAAMSFQVPETEFQVVRNEFLEDGKLLIVLYGDADMRVVQEATYIFKNSEYFYFVSYETSSPYSSKENLGSRNLSRDDLQSYLNTLYSACEFNR